MGNPLSNLILIGWPLICLVAFARFKPTVAILISIMGAMLFLPEKVELKAPFQPLGKQEFAAIGAILGVLLVGAARRKLVASRPFTSAEVIVLVMMIGAFGTSQTNQEPLNYGMANLQPLNTWEAISVCVGNIYTYLIPFVLGRAMFTTRADALTLLRGFQVAALIYVPFIMTEIVMSPQMHNWVYGFAQHDFIQTMRGGGYRPMVFMGHGLGLALFLAASCLAGVIMTLAKKPTILRLKGRWMSLFLLVVLIGCKSLGAAIFAFLFAGVLQFFTPRWQMRVLLIFAALIVLYPISRATEVFPHKEIIQFIKDTAGPDRAQSLEFRFTNEADLGEHAAKKPIFGWGRFRRNMLFSPWKDEPVSVSDGYWIVIYGVAGAWGALCVFGLLLAPIFYLRGRLKRLQTSEDRYLLVGMACMLMMYTVDLLPNGLFTNFPFFFAGALMGLIKGISETPPTSGSYVLVPMEPVPNAPPIVNVNLPPPVAPKVVPQS